MVYCVVPRELEPELLDRLTAYYADGSRGHGDRRSPPRRAPRPRDADRGHAAAAGPARPPPPPCGRASSPRCAARRRLAAGQRSPPAREGRRPRRRRLARQPGPGRRRGGDLDARRRACSTAASELLGVATNNVAEYRGLLLGLRARARARRRRGRGRQRLRAGREADERRLQGQAPRHAPAARAGAGRAARIRALVDPLGAARPERATPTRWSTPRSTARADYP